MKSTTKYIIFGAGALVAVGAIALLLELFYFSELRKSARLQKFLDEPRGIHAKSHPKSGWYGRPRWSDAELRRWAVGKRTTISHVIHFRARLTVNGYPVVFDEFRECVQSFKREFIRKGFKARTLIAKKLPDGSVVFTAFLPGLCRLFQESVAPRSSPHAYRESIPPKNFLMHYYWANDATSPSRLEGYLSHAYHKQKKKRLNLHSQEIRLAPYPTPHKILKEAERQAANARPLPFLARQGMQAARWRAVYGVTMKKSKWSEFPELRRAVASVPDRADFYSLGPNYEGVLLINKKPDVAIDWLAFRYGIPHPGQNHGLLLPGPTRASINPASSGTLRKRTRKTIDDAVPVWCSKGVCRILLDQRGYLIFYPTSPELGRKSDGPEMRLKDLKFIELKGQRIKYERPARLLYWRPKDLLIALNARSM